MRSFPPLRGGQGEYTPPSPPSKQSLYNQSVSRPQRYNLPQHLIHIFTYFSPFLSFYHALNTEGAVRECNVANVCTYFHAFCKIFEFSCQFSKEKSYFCRKLTNIEVKSMILEFCVTNFLSIKEELKLSFISTSLKEACSEPNDLFPLEDTGISLVRSAVIYGANASGKSNVLKAFDFYKRFVTESFKNSQVGDTIGVENFRLNASSLREPTTFEATFTDGEFIYRYGFEVDNHTVHEEWLYKRACKKRAKDVELFYREAESTTVHPKSQPLSAFSNG